MKKKVIYISSCIIVIILILLINFTKNTYSNKTITTIQLIDEILKNNTILENYDITNPNTGLYKENDTYYFKGNVINNYVQIDNDIWRIISLNNDNITLIKEEGINNNETYIINEDPSNNNYLDSTIKKELDEWLNNISYKNILLKKEYCISYNETCTNKEELLTTLISEDILEKIGYQKDSYNDLYLNKEYEWWLISNNIYDEEIDSAYFGYVDTDGQIDYTFTDDEKTIRPIITIDSKTSIEGNGLINTPYIVKK